METLVKLLPISNDLWLYSFIDLSIVLAFLITLKWIQGFIYSINVNEEISERDNFAVGIGLAGSTFSLCLVLSAVVTRHIEQSLQQAAYGMAVFGIVGIILVRVGRYIHDKIVLNRVNTPELLKNNNVGVALVDAGSAVASAIILRSMILWVDGSNANAIIAVTSGSFVVLVISFLLTRFYEYRFALSNQNDSFQGALKRGQLAVAIDHAGNVIGTAIVVTAASNLLIYSSEAYVSNVTGWLFVSLALSVSHIIIVQLSKYLVMYGIKVNKEIDLHHNVGIACVGFALNLGLAMLITEFFAR